METLKQYVLDTSAFFTFFEDEDGAEVVQNLLEQAKSQEVRILTSFVSFTEVFYVTFQEESEDEAERRTELMKQLPTERVDSSDKLGLMAGRLKAIHRIAFADAWIAATAKAYNAILVHKDPEFEQIKDEVTLLPLPYK